MKKLLYLMFASCLWLAACGETSEENVGGDVDKENTNENANQQTEETATQNDENEINEVIVDNENVKVTLVKIVKKSDEVWGNSVDVVFDVTNKRSDSIEVQARNVSVDDRMVDETLLTMSQEVAAGKSATATLTVNEFEGYEFPKFEKNFEMVLYIFSWDNADYSEEHPVSITF